MMNADQFLALADTLRVYAQHCGRDTNAANLFVHDMLMRALKQDGGGFDASRLDPRMIAQECAERMN
ncbi:MAG: hypothetical protein AB7P07_08820 [Hyphomonadaceae bacterium]